MSTIRPLARDDLPEIAALYELVLGSGRQGPRPGLATYFARVLLDQPWADPEIPSLVYIDDRGAIAGFQGSSVRRALFDGRPIRIAFAGQLVAHPEARGHAVGARLLRAYFDGAQELTITDTASDQMRRLWTLSGGSTIHLACIGWVRVLRPWGFAHAYLRRRRTGSARRHRTWGGRAPGGPLLRALDRASTRLGGRLAPPAQADTVTEPLTPSGVVEHLPAVAGTLRLHLDYDEPFTAWVWDELARLTGFGTPVARRVRRGDGRVLGWFVYLLARGGLSRVLQVAAAPQRAGPVLDSLLHDAWSRGAAGLLGRLEPALLEPLSSRRAVLHPAGTLALAHTADAQIAGAIATGGALLTRLDGEWWLQDREVDLGPAP
jgi:GNAT superfamily N-acetyltransferase